MGVLHGICFFSLRSSILFANDIVSSVAFPTSFLTAIALRAFNQIHIESTLIRPDLYKEFPPLLATRLPL
jgi:hypothetical protein